jgi:hypothetical protein
MPANTPIQQMSVNNVHATCHKEHTKIKVVNLPNERRYERNSHPDKKRKYSKTSIPTHKIRISTHTLLYGSAIAFKGKDS